MNNTLPIIVDEQMTDFPNFRSIHDMYLSLPIHDEIQEILLLTVNYILCYYKGFFTLIPRESTRSCIPSLYDVAYRRYSKP